MDMDAIEFLQDRVSDYPVHLLTAVEIQGKNDFELINILNRMER